ncbi:protein of unknown function [Cyclobacterium xiamenense]|uniref:TolB-like 6-blade propeller-like n=1 Tax=Cyclobacterium xiamenense TaxID=1297121 RepID=A0A1H6WEH1_9BACT|nr:DUF4221 family protein [Cyclobacterium xiamenense]SEJ15293.1 protein of unknown function [Cyclobacterium xiamenense]
MRSSICTVLILAVVLACSGTNQSEPVVRISSLDYSLDTVQIDAGDEILFVSRRLNQSDLSLDRQFLYNFNRQEHAFEKIDLDRLQLVRKFPFEKEGPNGTGSYFHSFFLLQNDRLMLGSAKKWSIFELNGRKIKEITFQEVPFAAVEMEESDNFFVKLAINEGHYLGLLRNYHEKSTDLLRVDLNAGRASRVAMPQFDRMKDFEFEFSDGKTYMYYAPELYLRFEGGKFLLGNDIQNDLAIYVPGIDSLRIIRYESELTANRKAAVPGTTTFDSQEAFFETYIQFREDIGFSVPVWDAQNEVYYRFSYKGIFERTPTEGHEWPQVTAAEVFLTVFDENLELLAESRIPDLTQPPEKHFVKDGKVWMFVNLRDEMGFARLSVDLEGLK